MKQKIGDRSVHQLRTHKCFHQVNLHFHCTVIW